MVRYHMYDLPKKDILAKSKFSAKLAGLPRFMTGKQLIEIGHMLNATAWIIPRNSQEPKSSSNNKMREQKTSHDKKPTPRNTYKTNDSYNQQISSWSDDILDTLNDHTKQLCQPPQ
ncbi:7050_t:CDS:2, partial [Funneliformis geosporum]